MTGDTVREVHRQRTPQLTLAVVTREKGAVQCTSSALRTSWTKMSSRRGDAPVSESVTPSIHSAADNDGYMKKQSTVDIN